MIYLRLFFEYFKTGLFSVGGGLATLPFLSDMADRTGWFTHQELADMVAVSESTPGPMGVNMASYVGFKTAGILGSICATAGLVAPCIIVILIIAGMLEKFRSNKIVENAFYGIRPASTAMISAALLSLCAAVFFPSGLDPAGIIIDIRYVVLFAVILMLINLKQTKKLHPLVFILGAAVAGVLFEL